MDFIAIVALATLGPAIGYSLLIHRRAAAGKPPVVGGDLVAIIVLGVIFGCLVNPVLIQAMLTFVVVCIAVFTNLRPRWVVAGCWMAALLPLLLAVVAASQMLAHVRDLRQKHPFVSLGSRLAYEKDAVAAADARAEELRLRPGELVLAAKVSQRLVEQEKITMYPLRTDGLERLHSTYADRFVLASGFGVGRMSGIRSYAIEAPEREPATIPQPVVGLASVQQEQIEPELLAANEAAEQNDALERLSRASEQDFLNAERFGYVRDGKVAGFIPHRFSDEASLSTTFHPAASQWQVARVSLVSLLKFSQPAVYLSDDLPNMERLASVPTRPLNAFEREALPKLRTQEDLVVRYSANTIRMLGSLRAGKTCLECHSVQRGELLGAFSYELRRSVPAPVLPAPPKKSRPEA